VRIMTDLPPKPEQRDYEPYRSLAVGRRKKRRRFLRVAVAPIIELRRARVTLPGGLLHLFELRAVLERRRDECRAHPVRRVATVAPEHGSIFPHHAIDRVGVH